MKDAIMGKNDRVQNVIYILDLRK